MDVYNTTGKRVVGIGATEHGGVMNVYTTTGKQVAGIGAVEYGNGAIQTYKGGWRTH